MTQILETQSVHVRQLQNFKLLADGAIQQRNAAERKLSGLKQLINELHQTQQDVLHYKDRANHHELALLRTEAHLKKAKAALWNCQVEISELNDRIKSFEDEKRHWIPAKKAASGATDTYQDATDSESDLETDSAVVTSADIKKDRLRKQHKPQIDAKDIATVDRAIQVTPSPDDIASSIPKEKHNRVLKDNVRLQFLVQDLTRKEGLQYKKVMQISELEDQVAQLRAEFQDKSDQYQKLRRDIQNAKTSEDVAGQLLETQLQFQKVEKANALKQVINETLSQYVEKLTRALHEAQAELAKVASEEEEHYQLAESGAFGNTAENEANNDGGALQLLAGSNAQTDGKPIARRPTPKHDNTTQSPNEEGEKSHDSIIAQPSDETDGGEEKRPHWEQKEKTEVLELQVKHLLDKVDRLTEDCKRLLTEKVMASQDRAMYETRYNELMETVKQTNSSQSSTSACSECREHEKAIRKMEDEMANMKSEIEMVTAQKRMFEEDLEQEQLDAQHNKEQYKAQIEAWKKNCVTLGKQVNLFKGDLDKERQKVKILEREMGKLQQKTSQILRTQQQTLINRPYTTMQPMPLCATEAERPHVNPFQEGFNPLRRGILAVDGAGGVDEFDGREQPRFESASDSMQKSAVGHMNECPRCKRVFEFHEQQDFQRHLDKCVDSA